MTVYRLIQINCDWPRCYARSENGHFDLAQARKVAAGEGWKNYRGLIDLCGPVDLVPSDRRDAGIFLPQNHAAAGHEPVLTPAGKGRVSVACSCRWKDPTAWPATRDLAKYRWAKHLQNPVIADGGDPR